MTFYDPKSTLPLAIILQRIGLLGIVVATGLLDRGYVQPIIDTHWLHTIQLLGIVIYFLDFWRWRPIIANLSSTTRLKQIAILMHSLAALSALAAIFQYDEAWVIFDLLAAFMLCVNGWWLNVAMARRLQRPDLLLPIGFVGLILIGTVLIKLPLASTPGRSISTVDALFTMTSAVCVTGLSVRDTATDFTPLGQMTLGMFILLGGLGVMIFGTVLAQLLGTRSSLREEISLSRMLNDQPLQNVARLTQFILLSTLGCIVVGAAIMMPMWHGPMSWTQRLGTSLFHATSAFCNAGFSLQSDSLESYRYSILSQGIIVALLVIGGLGFPVLHNLWKRAKNKEKFTLHTKLVLTTTAALYLYGVVGLTTARLIPYITDAAGLNITANATAPPTLTPQHFGSILADASFLSWTSRTAGFNTTPMSELSNGECLVTMTLMMVGGSPGGTAGGMRTTTLALILLGIVATLRQRKDTEAFGRRLAMELIQKAGALAACYIGLVCLVTLLLCFSEPFGFMKLLFEAVSAVTVTGLSLGITGELTTFGKIVIIVAMFLGRIGPLTLAASLLFNGKQGARYRFAQEDVLLG